MKKLSHESHTYLLTILKPYNQLDHETLLKLAPGIDTQWTYHGESVTVVPDLGEAPLGYVAVLGNSGVYHVPCLRLERR